MSRVILKQSEIKKSDVCPSKQISCSFGLSSIQFFAREHLKIKLRPYNVGMPIKSEIDLDLSQVPVASYVDLDRELLVFIANSM